MDTMIVNCKKSDSVNLNRTAPSIIRAICFVATLAITFVCLSGSSSAQQIQIQFGGQLAQGQTQQIDAEAGAVLKTNPELEDVLQTAERKREDGQYRVASKLWQIVLERSGDALYSDDSSTYFSLVEQVEAILAGLPPEGLTAYRVIADAEAKEVMAQATEENDVIALNKVVRLYFISSLGDEAAFRLGCIYLDQFDFIGARRMFEKITRGYPDPTVPMDQVYARIALCQSYLGDLKSARASLEQADQVRSDAELVDLVRKSLGELATGDNRNVVNDDWTMPMGNNQRYGTMQGLPDEVMESDLAAVWQFYFEPRDKYPKAVDLDGKMLTGKNASGEDVKTTMLGPETRLVKAWRDKGWRPAGELLLDGDRVFFKTGGDLSVWSRKKIMAASEIDASQVQLDSAISWRSVWKNAFQVDDATQMMNTIRKSWGGGRRTGQAGSSNLPTPYTAAEVNLFGDRIFQEMSIYDGVVYSIEGKSFDDRNSHNSTPRVQPQWNASFRRTRMNYLTAYDAESGIVNWTLPRESLDVENANPGVGGEEEESPWLEGGGFMSAPIGFGELILAPVNIGGAVSIYAFDPKQEGKTVWKSFLCDEPETGSVPWSAIDLSIEGSDLFVTCGMGVVFVLDPATGTVRFAKRYRRVGTPDNFGRRSGWTVNRLNFDGWSNDIVIPYGRQMICFASDTDTIEAFDRNTGQLIWRSEMNPVGYKVDYVLGIYNDMLYAGGFETIVAYDLKGEGRMVWGTDQVFDGKQSLGRGIVTPKGIYMPVEDSIYQFSLSGNKGKADLLAKVHVDLGTDAPVGNLYSDGERFWVHGANRLYALGKAKD
jgi:tetratricopeptide (TPR) repeat protein